MTTAAAVLVGAAALIAGCGGDDGSADDPLAAALAYMPADTPFAAAFSTDLDSEQYQAVDGLIEPVAGAGVREALSATLAASGAPFSFEEDIEPALGNPVVLSATDVTTFVGDGADDDFVAAIQSADGDALERLIEESGAEPTGEIAGATVYGDELAVDDEMVILAGNEQLLTEALERADSGDGLSPETYDAAFEDLPEDALADVYFNVGELIANDPDTEQAQAVPWVSALTTFGMTFSVSESEISAEFNLRSDGGELSDEDIPLATGTESPGVIQQPGRIGIGLRGPSQVIRFFEDTLALVEPDQFAAYEDAKPVIADQFGVDIDEDIIDQLTGDLAVSLDLDGGFEATVDLADPAEFSATLDDLVEALPALGSEIGIERVNPAGENYVAHLADGTRVVFGVVDGALQVANDPVDPPLVAEASAVEGAEGALVASADLGEIVGQALDALRAQLGEIDVLPPRSVFGQLGELIASVETSTEATRGTISLTLE